MQWLLIWLMVLGVPLYSASSSATQSFIHEAFILPSSIQPIYRSVPVAPPPPLKQAIPEQKEMQAVWIPGYWAWDSQANVFVWVSGVWRRPPPGHEWISGFWKADVNGWAWLPGFWSAVSLESLAYVNAPPPEEQEESIAPAPSAKYFWVPGYWRYSWHELTYIWMRGRWESFDPEWMLIPASYVWRPEGYVFVPAYWDWPLEVRGTVYFSSLIHSSSGQKLDEPMQSMPLDSVIQALFPQYPNYLASFQYYWHFHQSDWKPWDLAPPWWKWNSWWALSWKNQWALWWWYTHPGYPQPNWMTPELAHLLPPPLNPQTASIADLTPPPMITPKGAVSSDVLLLAIREMRGNMDPIFPYLPLLANRVIKIVGRKSGELTSILKPSGQRLPVDPGSQVPLLHKPSIGDSEHKPAEPVVIPHKPKVPHHPRSSVWQDSEKSSSIRRNHWDPHKRYSTSPSEVPPAISEEKWRKMQSFQEPHLMRPSIPREGV